MSYYARVATHGVADATHNEIRADDDDWDTDPEPANMISEKEQRRGAATLPQDSIEDYSDVHALRERVKQQDSEVLAGNYESGRSNVGNSYGQDRARK